MPAFYTTAVVAFTFVLARVSGLVMTAPLFGSSEVPGRVRALLAFTLAVLVTPIELSVPLREPENLVLYAVGLGSELLVGLLMGMGVKILLSGVQVAGQIVSQMSGMSLADVFNPGFDSEVPVVAH